MPSYLLGPVAQLARAPGWQSGGRGFEPPRVHNLPKSMKERYDEQSQDLYIWITPDEVSDTENPQSTTFYGWLRSVNKDSKVAVYLRRTFKEEGRSIDVEQTQTTNNEEQWNNFTVAINDYAWDYLKEHRWARDRYGMSQKVTILIGTPEIEGPDAMDLR